MLRFLLRLLHAVLDIVMHVGRLLRRIVCVSWRRLFNIERTCGHAALLFQHYRETFSENRNKCIICRLRTCLLRCHTELIIAGEFAAIEKFKLWIILLLLFGNCFELGSIACHKFGQFINYIA